MLTLVKLLLAKVTQASFDKLLDVLLVPLNGQIATLNPAPVSLLKVKLELPGIFLVTFVQVLADKEPVSKAYLCPVPSYFE